MREKNPKCPSEVVVCLRLGVLFFLWFFFFLMVFLPSPGLFYITSLKVGGGAFIQGVRLTPA